MFVENCKEWFCRKNSSIGSHEGKKNGGDPPSGIRPITFTRGKFTPLVYSLGGSRGSFSKEPNCLINRLLFTVFIAFFTGIGVILNAQSNLWLPLPSDSLETLLPKGTKLEELQSAVGDIGGFCTGTVISKEGLLLTTYHGAERILPEAYQQLEAGFWAANPQEEVPIPGLFVRFLVRMEDITQQILPTENNLTEAQRKARIENNRLQAQLKIPTIKGQDVQILPFDQGTRYFLIVTTTFQDVRLVGLPPLAIYQGGSSEQDNMQWPRFSGDFALFRIYSGENGTPEAYDAGNEALQPNARMQPAISAPVEYDSVFSLGYPKATWLDLPPVARSIVFTYDIPVQQFVDSLLLNRAQLLPVAYREKARDIQSRYNQTDLQLQAVTKLQPFIQEERKVWQRAANDTTGQLIALYQEIKDKFRNNRSLFEDKAYADHLFEHLPLFQISRRLRAYLRSPDHRFADYQEGILQLIQEWQTQYDAESERLLFRTFVPFYFERIQGEKLSKIAIDGLLAADKNYDQLTAAFFSKSLLAYPDKMITLLQRDPVLFKNTLSGDYGFRFFESIINANAVQINRPYQSLQEELNPLYRKYQQFNTPASTGQSDANGTLRLSVGQVRSYGDQPLFSILKVAWPGLSGSMQNLPGDAETSVCFTDNRQASGGSSGSPVLNKDGQILGIHTERIGASNSSDYFYDADIHRNTVLDIRLIMKIIQLFCPELYQEIQQK